MRIPINLLDDIPGLLLLYLVVVIAWVIGFTWPLIIRYLGIDVWFVVFEQLGFNLDGWFIWLISMVLTVINCDFMAIRDIYLDTLLTYAILLWMEIYH